MKGFHLSICIVLMGLILHLQPSLVLAQEQLRWQFTEGQAFDLHITQAMNSKVVPEEIQGETTMETELYIRWQIDSVDGEGTAQVTQTIQRAVLTMTLGEPEPVRIDTDSPDEATGLGAVILESVQAIINQEALLKITNQGEILELTLSEEAQAAQEKASGPISGDLIQQSIQLALLWFPAEELSTGSTWSHQLSMPSMGASLELLTDYTYLGPQEHAGRNLAAIDSTPTLSLGETEEEPEFEMQISNSTGEGHAWFDAEAGYLVKSNTKQAFELEMQISGTTMRTMIETESRLEMTPVEGE